MCCLLDLGVLSIIWCSPCSSQFRVGVGIAGDLPKGCCRPPRKIGQLALDKLIHLRTTMYLFQPIAIRRRALLSIGIVIDLGCWLIGECLIGVGVLVTKLSPNSKSDLLFKEWGSAHVYTGNVPVESCIYIYIYHASFVSTRIYL